jgi:hypothetical protein
MKSKISVTMDRSLLEFLDSLPGGSRSEKIESAVRKFKKVTAEKELRVQLGSYREENAELAEREIWESAVAEAMWTE